MDLLQKRLIDLVHQTNSSIINNTHKKDELFEENELDDDVGVPMIAGLPDDETSGLRPLRDAIISDRDANKMIRVKQLLVDWKKLLLFVQDKQQLLLSLVDDCESAEKRLCEFIE